MFACSRVTVHQWKMMTVSAVMPATPTELSKTEIALKKKMTQIKDDNKLGLHK